MDRSSDISNDAADRETEQVYEVCIVGAGPIGLELGVCLKQAGLTSSILMPNRSATR